MSTGTDDERNTLSKKINLLFKFRDYVIISETEEEDYKDTVVTKRGKEEKTLIRVVFSAPLVSGKVGVHYVRKMKEKIDKEAYKNGILIGKDFSYSARKEARSYGIETIHDRKIPAFNIFEHYLVPKHEIVPREEARRLLRKYHVGHHQLPRIRASDPAVFLIGAKRGDIVKIRRESPTAGIHITYRHVV